MSAPVSRDPLVVNTQDGRCWVRRAWSQDGHGLYGLEGTPVDAEQTLLSLRELAGYGLRTVTDVLPVPVGSEPQEYGAVMPWAVLMDDDDLSDFLDELAASAVTYGHGQALAEVEATCARWRLIAEAQHAHNTAPGPDAMTRTFAPTQALRDEDPFGLHHTCRAPRDLPELGGAS